MASEHLQDFINSHRLPASYLDTAEKWYQPLATTIANQHQPGTTYLVAINGTQGSGKSTLAAYLEAELSHRHQLSVAVLSIDDFYLTRSERQVLANDIHPLLKTRGVPGTHDTDLAIHTIDQLSHNTGTVAIPRFNKATDDRHPLENWSNQRSPCDIIILEGWCMGAQPQESLEPACNTLEQQEDSNGAWRQYVNQKLQQDYLPLFDRFDLWIMLRAPSFDQVFQWRLQQEQKLAEVSSGSQIMSEPEIQRFIQHYQRLTENCLSELPAKTHFCYQLDAQRQPQSLKHPLPINQRANFLTAAQ
jgi:D-glycerate 3-kinase